MDVILLCVGAFTIGWSVVDVAKLLFTFGNKTVKGNRDSDLDEAASALSRAVTLAGFTVIMALLLRRSVKKIGIARGANVAYVTTGELISEGAALGTVVAGTQHFRVQFVPTDTARDSDAACYPMELPAFVCGGQ